MTIFKIYLLLAALGLTAARAFLSLQRVGATFEMPWGGGFSSRWLLWLRSTGSRARRLQ